MAIALVTEKSSGIISTVTIGATPEEGGSRAYRIQIGGQGALPYLSQEGALPNPTIVAWEIWDTPALDWADELGKAYAKTWGNPLEWAQKCVEEYDAKLLCVKLQGAHPDTGNKSPADCAKFIEKLLATVKVPLIILGCGDDTKDNLILPASAQAAKAERCLIGCAVQDNYKTLVAAALADGHNIIAESPIDINIAKQLNILISDMGLGLERIVINPTIGALGYGLEYAYSIMERARLAGLAGDKTLALPFICLVGQEAWRAKEAKIAGAEQGIAWEIITATALIQAGADILVMRHPKAIEEVNKYIAALKQE